MSTVLEIDDPITSTYKDVEGIIHKVVQRHIKSYGGDYEELIAEANMIFMKVYKDFNPDKGIFGKRVRFTIEKRLIDYHRKEWKTNPKDRKEYAPLEECPGRSNFDVNKLMDNLSDDAQIAVKFALGMIDDQKPDGIREVMIDLLFALGWSGQRISDAINEVRGSLK